jgi:hypothetical protein
MDWMCLLIPFYYVNLPRKRCVIAVVSSRSAFACFKKQAQLRDKLQRESSDSHRSRIVDEHKARMLIKNK